MTLLDTLKNNNSVPKFGATNWHIYVKPIKKS